ncbi:LysR family transcriptional regulator [Trinickia fusca]|uniref:LysR family transcriptional regulator n=1 Tax=Trinickia fusca TaxID=2419777 RepID=A0A494XC97_9BURK|nr:LysR family transcriptional regulator [Trinickia fusca]RKP48487.1 LysR family transcriptional regulator [Trinickia fusca]
MDWDDTRIFLAVQRERTLRGAAKTLDLDQATVGRRIAALERSLSATLFLRTSDGYVLTPAGELALKAAEKMEHAAHELVRHTHGVDTRLEGDVRVTTTDSIAQEFLIPAIVRLHAKHPDVRVLLSTSTQTLNLAKREADIAVRTIKPENPDLIARRLARWPMGLFASKGYLKKRGEPNPGTAFAGHDIVLYHSYMPGSGNRAPTLAGEPIHAGRIVSAVNSNLMLRSQIKAGLGLGEIPVLLGERDGLVRVWPERTRAELYEVWLVTHQDLRHTTRIRAMIDEIVQAFECQ